MKLNEIRRFKRIFNFDSNENSNNVDKNEKKFVDNDFVVSNFIKLSKKKNVQTNIRISINL